MWQQFTSSFFNKVDAKGRVSVPALFRKALELRGADGRLVLVPGFRDKHCVEGYAPDAYERLARSVRRMHPSDPRRKKLEYRLMGRAQPLDVDENGRIVLPADLRARYDLGAEAVFVGLGDSFQIWSREGYETHVAPILEADEDDDDAFAALPWDEDDA